MTMTIDDLVKEALQARLAREAKEAEEKLARERAERDRAEIGVDTLLADLGETGASLSAEMRRGKPSVDAKGGIEVWFRAESYGIDFKITREGDARATVRSLQAVGWREFPVKPVLYGVSRDNREKVAEFCQALWERVAECREAEKSAEEERRLKLRSWLPSSANAYAGGRESDLNLRGTWEDVIAEYVRVLGHSAQVAFDRAGATRQRNSRIKQATVEMRNALFAARLAATGAADRERNDREARNRERVVQAMSWPEFGPVSGLAVEYAIWADGAEAIETKTIYALRREGDRFLIPFNGDMCWREYTHVVSVTETKIDPADIWETAWINGAGLSIYAPPTAEGREAIARLRASIEPLPQIPDREWEQEWYTAHIERVDEDIRQDVLEKLLRGI